MFISSASVGLTESRTTGLVLSHLFTVGHWTPAGFGINQVAWCLKLQGVRRQCMCLEQ